MLAKFAEALTRANFLFSLRSFGGAATALYIAFVAQLDEPSWAFMTAYIVSQPLAGQMASKGFYRFVATFVGAVLSLAFTGMFAQAPPFFVLCVVSWISFCTFLSARLRGAPYSYVFALAGYTTAIIGFSEGTDPSNAFNIAQTRFLEISLGIFCATFFHLVFFPSRAGEKLTQALDSALNEAAELTDELLEGSYDPTKVGKKLASVVKANEDLAFLRLYATYDTHDADKMEPTVIFIESQMGELVTALISWHMLIERSSGRPELKGEALKQAAAVRDFISNSLKSLKGNETVDLKQPASDLIERLTAATPPPETIVTDTDTVAHYAALRRLIGLVEIWRGILEAHSHFKAVKPYVLSVYGPKIRRYHDDELALVSAGVAFVSLMAAWMFWYITAWPNGSGAISFAAILTTLMAPMDDPRKASRSWFPMGIIAAASSLFFLFVIFQRLTAFPELVLAIAPFYIFLGIIQATKKGSGAASAVITLSASMISFQNKMDYNFSSTVNSQISTLTGVLFAVAGFALLRPLGEDWTLMRVRRGMYNACADAIVAPRPPSRTVFKALMMDRINDVLSRIDMSEREEENIVKGSLAALLIGANTLNLRSLAPNLPPDAAAKIESAMLQFVPLLHAHGDSKRAPKRDYLGLLDAAREDLGRRELSPTVLSAIASLEEIRGMYRSHPAFFGLTPSQNPGTAPVDDGVAPPSSAPEGEPG